MKKENMRTVNYFGMNIEIWASHEYVATDADGKIFAFEEKPVCMKDEAGWYSGKGTFHKVISHTNSSEAWEESLRCYPKEPEAGEPEIEAQTNECLTVEPKTQRGREFAAWFDKTFYPASGPKSEFRPENPWSVLMYVQEKTNMFAAQVRNAVVKHIDEYTVPQYGDAPNDNVASWPREQCLSMVWKYKAREGTSRRSEGNSDYWKMMHYCQLADCKPAEENEEPEDVLIRKILSVFNEIRWHKTKSVLLHITMVGDDGKRMSLEVDTDAIFGKGSVRNLIFLGLNRKIDDILDKAKQRRYYEY